MKHILPTELVNRVLTYLATRPYTEVMAMIKEIQEKSVPYSDDVSTEVEEVPSE